jgi:hypothetical protein
MKEETLTIFEALQVMQRFLEMYWERGSSEEIAILLGSLSIQSDGKCADPALWQDWLNSVKAIKTQ